MKLPIEEPGIRSLAHEDKASIHFDYALNGILETDAQWRIQRCNQASQSILQRSAKALNRQALDVFLNRSSDPNVDRHFQMLWAQGIYHSVLRLPAANGTHQWLELSSVQAQDELYIHFIDDLTLQYAQANAQAAAREAAEDANQAKTAFLANVSHELRTPLNGILGLTQLCLLDDLPAQTRQHVEKIARSGQTLLRLLNDLLDLSRVESGRMEYEQLPFDLWELLDELAATVSHLALGKPLEIAFLLDPALPRWIMGDRLRLHQVLTNLLGNAVKFTDQGEVALELDGIEGPHGRDLQLSVRDSGPGLDAGTLDRLFQPFTQADSSTTRRFGGTGLGLAISRELTRGMGGELGATSIPGQGSCFTVRLPLQPAPQQAPSSPGRSLGLVGVTSNRPLTRRALHQLLQSVGAQAIDLPADEPSAVQLCAHIIDAASISAETWPAASASPTLLLTDAQDMTRWQQRTPAPPRPHIVTRPLTPLSLQGALEPDSPSASGSWDVPQEFRGARIAVAEDMPINHDVIVGLLQRAGIEVLLARNGAELLELLAAAEPAPELVLMDVHMPVRDGVSATRALRARGCTLPVVALSSGALKTEQADCLSAGMDDFLSKPVDPDELWGTLTRWLPPRRTRGSAVAPAAATTTGRHSLGHWKAAGIDVDDAIARFLGRSDVLETALGHLQTQHGPDPDTIAKLLARDQPRAALEMIHALKGCAATVGAHELQHCCQQLEARLREDPRHPVRHELDALQVQMERLLQVTAPLGGS